MSNYRKCDVCSKFGGDTDLNDVTITITKHEACSVDSLFSPKVEPIALPRVFTSLQEPTLLVPPIDLNKRPSTDMDVIKDVNKQNA